MPRNAQNSKVFPKIQFQSSNHKGSSYSLRTAPKICAAIALPTVSNFQQPTVDTAGDIPTPGKQFPTTIVAVASSTAGSEIDLINPLQDPILTTLNALPPQFKPKQHNKMALTDSQPVNNMLLINP